MNRMIGFVVVLKISCLFLLLFFITGKVTAQEERVNHALSKPAEHWKDTWYQGPADRAVDGNPESSANSWARDVEQHWWQVDLTEETNIREIRISNPHYVTSDYYVLISNSEFGDRSLTELLDDSSITALYQDGAFLGRLSIPTDTDGRYVRIQLAGPGLLQLGEVEIYSEPNPDPIDPFDLDNGKLFSHWPGSLYNSHAHYAIDNDIETRTYAWSRGKSHHYWQIDLRELAEIELVQITSGSAGQETLQPFYIFISEEPFGDRSFQEINDDSSIHRHFQSEGLTGTLDFPFDVVGRFVRVQRDVGWQPMIMSEIDIQGSQITPVELDSDGDGITDLYEDQNGLLKFDASDAGNDLDGDGVSNLEEFELGLAADNEDSDSDGIPDGGELRWGLDPTLEIGSFEDGNLLGDCDDDKRIIHVLNRLSFGPTKALYDELKGTTNCQDSADSAIVDANISAWVENQLDNGSSSGIPGEKERRQANAGLGSVEPVVELLEGVTLQGIEDGVAAGVLEDKPYFYKVESLIESAGDVCWVARQPQGGCINSQTTDPGQCLRDIHRQHAWQNEYENMQALRPVHSRQHLRTKIGRFWDNHFNTNSISAGLGSRLGVKQEAHESDTFFMNAYGNFYNDILIMSAKSPTMINFLNLDDNRYTNTDDYVPNENYARELLELHTMGEGAGYDQEDVHELARLLTGWTAGTEAGNGFARYRLFEQGLAGSSGGPTFEKDSGLLCTTPRGTIGDVPVSREINSFEFDMSAHDPNPKILTIGDDEYQFGFEGQTLSPNEALMEGEAAIQILAERPETANFICTKMAKLLVSDNPTDSLIQGCATAFLGSSDSDNQMQGVIANLLGFEVGNTSLDSNQSFYRYESHRTKYKDIFEYGYGLARLFDMAADINNVDANTGKSESVSRGTIGRMLDQVGAHPFLNSSPEGWPETADKWTNTAQSALRMSLNFNVLREYLKLRNKRLGGNNSEALNDYFKKHLFTNDQGNVVIPEDADKIIASYLLKMMFGGYYDQGDVVLAYKVMNDTIDFDLPPEIEELVPPVDEETRLFRNAHMLIYVLSSHYKYSLQ